MLQIRAWTHSLTVIFVPVFVAHILTINVSIPTVGIVPLRSVNGWLTVMSRVDSNFPDNLNWASYKVGFGDTMSNFWLGLERIYQLTNINANGQMLYRLRFEVESLAAGGYEFTRKVKLLQHIMVLFLCKLDSLEMRCYFKSSSYSFVCTLLWSNDSNSE